MVKECKILAATCDNCGGDWELDISDGWIFMAGTGFCYCSECYFMNSEGIVETRIKRQKIKTKKPNYNFKKTIMKLKDLKKKLDLLTKEQLEQQLHYNSERHSVSGVVRKIAKQKVNLYCDFSDDPAPLLTLKQLKEEYENDEMDQFVIEIPKGAFVLEF